MNEAGSVSGNLRWWRTYQELDGMGGTHKYLQEHITSLPRGQRHGQLDGQLDGKPLAQNDHKPRKVDLLKTYLLYLARASKQNGKNGCKVREHL